MEEGTGEALMQHLRKSLWQLNLESELFHEVTGILEEAPQEMTEVELFTEREDFKRLLLELSAKHLTTFTLEEKFMSRIERTCS